MNINSTFSKSLKAEDLQGARPIVTIDRVEIQKVGDDKKPVLFFVGKEKGLILNRTNANTLIEMIGTPETEAWTGHRVQMVTAMVDYQGKRVPAIRLQIPQVPQPQAQQGGWNTYPQPQGAALIQPQATTAAPVQTQPTSPVYSDDIPF